MMTEEDAKTKWCPFVRHSADGQATFNRGDTDPLNNIAGPGVKNHDAWLCNCIASKCMAWRDHDRIVETGRKIPTSMSVAKPVGNWYCSYSVDEPVWVETAVERVGYCGLAGRPE